MDFRAGGTLVSAMGGGWTAVFSHDGVDLPLRVSGTWSRQGERGAITLAEAGAGARHAYQFNFLIEDDGSILVNPGKLLLGEFRINVCTLVFRRRER